MMDCGHKYCGKCLASPTIVSTHGRVTKSYRRGPFALSDAHCDIMGLRVNEKVRTVDMALVRRPRDSCNSAKVHTLDPEKSTPHAGGCTLCRIDAMIVAEKQLTLAHQTMIRPIELRDVTSAKILEKPAQQPLTCPS